jgi:uncharacterized lipoprotein YbaY
MAVNYSGQVRVKARINFPSSCVVIVTLNDVKFIGDGTLIDQFG